MPKTLTQAITEAVTEMRLAAGALLAVHQHARAEALLLYADSLEGAVAAPSQ